MNEYIDFKTFLSVSPNQFGIYLIDSKNQNVLYEKEFETGNEGKIIDFNNLDKFLEENIFNIEKLINQFVKNIFLIIDHEKIINHTIGTKKKNFNTKQITNLLAEVKDLFSENYNNYKIMHIIINKILIDGNYYSKFLSEIEANDISVEIQFIAIPKVVTSEYEKILEHYQIKITSYLGKKYIQNFFLDKEKGMALRAYKIQNGHNDNEVKIIPKNIKKLGFFEKFFQLFS